VTHWMPSTPSLPELTGGQGATALPRNAYLTPETPGVGVDIYGASLSGCALSLSDPYRAALGPAESWSTRSRAIIGNSVPCSSIGVPKVSSRTGRSFAQERGCAAV